MKRYDAAALGRSEPLESGNPGFVVLGGTHENKVVSGLAVCMGWLVGAEV